MQRLKAAHLRSLAARNSCRLSSNSRDILVDVPYIVEETVISNDDDTSEPSINKLSILGSLYTKVIGCGSSFFVEYGHCLSEVDTQITQGDNVVRS
jgi:hypothetical protein|eukprot:scaffold2604_cov198-Alexandrium_tamarense.AAC.10